MAYAEKSSVPRAELERTLARYGATSFGYMTAPGSATVMFEAHGRRIRFDLPLPRPDEPRFTHHARGKRTATAAQEAWEQACRQRWRALNLAVKAKLEAVDAGISEFEDEFLAFICLPSGQTMADVARPAIADAYASGSMPALTMQRSATMPINSFPGYELKAIKKELALLLKLQKRMGGGR